MTVSVYTDSEGTNWAMGFPHDYQWETENDRIWLSEMYDDDGLRKEAETCLKSIGVLESLRYIKQTTKIFHPFPTDWQGVF